MSSWDVEREATNAGEHNFHEIVYGVLGFFMFSIECLCPRKCNLCLWDGRAAMVEISSEFLHAKHPSPKRKSFAFMPNICR